MLTRKDDRMSTMYVPALAAFGGSAFGAISTIVSGWVPSQQGALPHSQVPQLRAPAADPEPDLVVQRLA